MKHVFKSTSRRGRPGIHSRRRRRKSHNLQRGRRIYKHRRGRKIHSRRRERITPSRLIAAFTYANSLTFSDQTPSEKETKHFWGS